MLHRRNVFIVFICWSVIINSEAIIRNEDICGIQNGRRLYLELGEQGVLFAKNVSFIKNSPRLQDSRIYTTNSSHDQCSLELVTCPSCVINLTFKSIGLSQNCGDGSFMLDSSCRCDYVWISEPPYEDVSGTPFCGFYSPISYRSNTRTLSITLLYSQSHNHAFTLEYTSERNRINLQGSDISSGIGKSRNSTIGGILTSPFFPSRYPRDLGMEYVITCPTESPSCRVRVLFSDFQLAAVSIIEFYDWNGQRLDVSSGVRFRPPVIVSSGPSLLIRFYANGGTGLGYKAFYSFVLGHLYDKSVQPITDCGGYVENLGGAITMMDMVDDGVKIYDCVWLIRPPKTFLQMKTHVYLKIITFDDMAGSTELIIKQGPTSALLPLEILRHPASKLQPRRLKEHIAPITSGFHVSLRGTFGPTSHLAMAYTTFSYTDCFTGSDFLCQNHRCIPSHLNCDGFDHCGDNSDEPSTCVQDWELAPQDKKWHTNKANYYFPKIDQYPDLKTATLVFVASSLGLITLISALIVLLYRMGARARQQRELQSRLQTISELLDGARIEEVTVTDDPPDYESPPGYEEVVKLSLENEHKKRKKKKSNSTCQLNRNLPENPNDNEANGSGNIPVDNVASTSDCVVSNQPTVPESPPPPYRTPPGTIENRMKFFALSESSCSTDGATPNGEQYLEVPAEGEMNRESSSSTDAELLGAYLQNYPENQTESSAPQLSSWKDASTNINPESEAGSRDLEVVRDGAEDKRTKRRSHRSDDLEGGPSTSTSAPSEMEAKKTAKPRSKRREKNKGTPGSVSPLPNSTTTTTSSTSTSSTSASTSSTSTFPSTSSTTTLANSQVFPIVTAPVLTEGINSTNPTQTLNSYPPIPVQPTQTSLISSIKASLNFPTQTFLISSIKTSLHSSNQNSVISSIKNSLNTLSDSSENRPTIILKNPVITNRISLNPRVKSVIEGASFSNFSDTIRDGGKNSPKYPTIISPLTEEVLPPKIISSPPVETHSRKLKCVLTSCAVASSSSDVNPVGKLSPTEATYSKRLSPKVSVSSNSGIPSPSGSSRSVGKILPNLSIKDSVESASKIHRNSFFKNSSLSVKASSSASGKTSSTLAKASKSVSAKASSSASANASSSEKAPASSSSSSNPPTKISRNPLMKNSNSSTKASSNFSIKDPSGPVSKSSLSSSMNSSTPSENSSSNSPSVSLKATSSSAAETSPSSLVRAASTSYVDSRKTEKSKLKTSASHPVKMSSLSSSIPTEKSSLLSISKPVSSLISPESASPGSSSLDTNTKNGIIKLLGNSRIKSPCKINRYYSTPSSSPVSTIGKSFMRNNYSRKYSICSHDSYATKISALSASSSYEKLNDDIEILSEYSSNYDFNSSNNTPFNTPKIQNVRPLSLATSCSEQCAKCDLDSLYEGIRRLDSFIARRENNVNCTGNLSRATTTLFGTPCHFSKSVDKTDCTIRRKSFSNSADNVDVLSE
ncbi:serine-rich adhesin for platelets isoform X2 [Leptopilina heterotoma]|uniref:serine-rich adhesin for platelets isoform X2 n=1 Tax=Leptopilina heterotoma TaxID=63436 RepID=UPI001CA9CCC0|nr:serine-rich adhesin for platelets isoform X2 [Leptopilina heterotoma]